MAEPKSRNRDWSREEFILALDLYVRKQLLDDHHPDVVELSQLLRDMAPEQVDINPNYRNPNGIALRLANFASVDPNYQGKGMRGLSRLGREIWEEYSKNWQQLSADAQLIRDGLRSLRYNNIDELASTRKVAESAEFEAFSQQDERVRVAADIVRRRGQATFRQQLMDAYTRKCCMTDCDAEDALEAAHILKYAGDRSNHVQNGLLLRADVHTLFDLGLIAVEPSSMTIKLAARIRTSQYASLMDRQLRTPLDGSTRPSRTALRMHFEASKVS
jgi:hypothetical protein